MRHGHGIDLRTDVGTDGVGSSAGSSAGSRLGCYFCNDVVAPGNSQKDRSLDQQCTVTRPGLAFIAAGMAVELMVALLHSPDRQRHPAPDSMLKNTGELAQEHAHCPVIPHQIRGSLADFTLVAPTSPAFAHCTACSEPVVRAYLGIGSDHCNDSSSSTYKNSSSSNSRSSSSSRSSECTSASVNFVARVCALDGPQYLEQLSGVALLAEELAELDLDLDMDEEEQE